MDQFIHLCQIKKHLDQVIPEISELPCMNLSHPCVLFAIVYIVTVLPNGIAKTLLDALHILAT
jgi:hypothetical protein